MVLVDDDADDQRDDRSWSGDRVAEGEPRAVAAAVAEGGKKAE